MPKVRRTFERMEDGQAVGPVAARNSCTALLP